MKRRNQEVHQARKGKYPENEERADDMRLDHPGHGADGVDLRALRSIRGYNLTALSARGAVFYGLDMEGVQLQGAHLEDADLRSVNLWKGRPRTQGRGTSALPS